MKPSLSLSQKKKLANSQKIIITRRASFSLVYATASQQAVLPQAQKGGAGREVKGKEGQECFKPALPPKAGNTVNTALPPSIREGLSRLKTNPPLRFLPLYSKRKGTDFLPATLFLGDYLYPVAFPSTLG